MNRLDARGCAVSGASAEALDAWERALAASLAWRRGADAHLDQALKAAPRFVMAHVLQAWQLLGGRDLRRVRAARPVLDTAAALPANERERQHLAAIAAVVRDDYDAAKALLGDLLRRHPRDVLALQVAHGLDYITGDLARMRDRVASVQPAWSCGLPGFHAVLSMQAFSLEECGDYAQAREVAMAALASSAADARAHHVMAHIFEMTGQAEAGVRWMNEHILCWGTESVVVTHVWWHLALFHLSLGRVDRALALYDRRVRAGRSVEIADLIDAASLLWRLHLQGVDATSRAQEHAAAWAPHIDDAFCSFSDLHAMLAFVAAGDRAHARELEGKLARAQARPTRHGDSTRLVGLPGSRALMAFGQGDDPRVIALLQGLPEFAHRLGGSHAQRDLLTLTLGKATERQRRSGRVAQVV